MRHIAGEKQKAIAKMSRRPEPRHEMQHKSKPALNQ
jgi:hypothetical protein